MFNSCNLLQACFFYRQFAL